MRVLLDIDGVMVSANSWKSPRIREDGFYDFNSRAVKNLNKIIGRTGASIILTTSHKSRFNSREWRTLFANRGINAPIKKMKTNSLRVGRKNEVLSWVNNHFSENYVIIDDDKTLNELPNNIKERIVLTCSGVGLTDELAEEAIQILEQN